MLFVHLLPDIYSEPGKPKYSNAMNSHLLPRNGTLLFPSHCSITVRNTRRVTAARVHVPGSSQRHLGCAGSPKEMIGLGSPWEGMLVWRAGSDGGLVKNYSSS